MAEFRLTPPRDPGAMGSVYGAADQMPSWLQSANVGPIPYSPPIGFEDMSPAERAAYRMRGGPPAPPPPLATPEEHMQAALMLANANPVLRAISAAPKIATGAGVLGSLLYSADPAGGADDPKAIMQEQRELKARGFYNGPIDGKVEGGTLAARAAAKADQAKTEQAVERLRIEGESAAAARATAEANAKAAEAQGGLAKAQAAETERKSNADRLKAEQRMQGDQTLTQMEKEISPLRAAVRDYSGPIGYGLGLVGGTATKALVTKASDRISQALAGRAERLIDPSIAGASGKAMQGRMANVNEFWRKGGAGGEVPFTVTPGSAPGFAANSAVAPINSLYQPSKVAGPLTDVGVGGGVFGGESLASEMLLAHPAREELKSANEAVTADPSGVNLRRLQAAKDNIAIAEGMVNFGRAGAIGYGGGAFKWQRQPSQPDFRPAESERLAIEDWLRRQAAASARKSPPGAAPTGGQPVPTGGEQMPPPSARLPSRSSRSAPEPSPYRPMVQDQQGVLRYADDGTPVAPPKY